MADVPARTIDRRLRARSGGIVSLAVVGASLLSLSAADAQSRAPAIEDAALDAFRVDATCGPTPAVDNPYSVNYFGPAAMGNVDLRIVEGDAETFGTVANGDPYTDSAMPGDDVQVFEVSNGQNSRLAALTFRRARRRMVRPPQLQVASRPPRRLPRYRP